jgi:hypothetical protein
MRRPKPERVLGEMSAQFASVSYPFTSPSGVTARVPEENQEGDFLAEQTEKLRESLLAKEASPQQDFPAPHLSWLAFEHEYRPRSQFWFIGVGGIAVVLIILGVLTRSYFFVAFVALAFPFLVFFAKRPPREFEFAVFREGIEAGGKFHPLSDVESFWIFDYGGGRREISLEMKRGIWAFLRFPLGDTDPSKVRLILRSLLPEKEHEVSMTDAVARLLGF